MNDERQSLIDFAALAGQLRAAVKVVGAAALFGAAAQSARMGIDGAVLLRWLTAFVALTLLCAAVLVALHAYRGATRVHERGERLAGDDVGLIPPRPPRPPARPSEPGPESERGPDA